MDTAEAALFAKVLERPDDQLALDAWMQCLRQNNDPRGDFVAIQREILRKDTLQERHLKLVRAEQLLLAKYRYEWAPVSCRDVAMGIKWRNGIPYAVQPPWIYVDRKKGLAWQFDGGSLVKVHQIKGWGMGEPRLAPVRGGVFKCLPDPTNTFLEGPITFYSGTRMEEVCDYELTGNALQVTLVASKLASGPGPIGLQLTGQWERFDTVLAKQTIDRAAAADKLQIELAETIEEIKREKPLFRTTETFRADGKRINFENMVKVKPVYRPIELPGDVESLSEQDKADVAAEIQRRKDKAEAREKRRTFNVNERQIDL